MDVTRARVFHVVERRIGYVNPESQSGLPRHRDAGLGKLVACTDELGVSHLEPENLPPDTAAILGHGASAGEVLRERPRDFVEPVGVHVESSRVQDPTPLDVHAGSVVETGNFEPFLEGPGLLELVPEHAPGSVVRRLDEVRAPARPGAAHQRGEPSRGRMFEGEIPGDVEHTHRGRALLDRFRHEVNSPAGQAATDRPVGPGTHHAALT